MPASPAVFYIVTRSGPRQWPGLIRVSGQLGDFADKFGADPALVQRSDWPEAIILYTPVSPRLVSHDNSAVPAALAATLPNVGFDRQDAGKILGGNDMRVFAASLT
jgi:hypothetical protein